MLETNRCNLLKLQESDYEDIKKLYLNERVRKFLGGTVDDNTYKNTFLDMYKCENESLYWVVRHKDNNEFIGLVSLDLHHDGINKEISYQLLPQYWGYGYGKEVIEKIITYAFEELKLQKIIAETQSANELSCKLLRKVGMRLEQIVQRFGEEQYIFSIVNNN